MRIAVLNLTGHPLPLFAGLPRAGTQIINWLSTELPEAEFYSVSIEADNEELPEPDIGRRSFGGGARDQIGVEHPFQDNCFPC